MTYGIGLIAGRRVWQKKFKWRTRIGFPLPGFCRFIRGGRSVSQIKTHVQKTFGKAE
jgi:hypothetical protein